jgi:hypothetical protein
MAVAVNKAEPGRKPVFEHGTPEPLFDSHIVPATNGEFYYDVTADGKHFLVATTAGTAFSSTPTLTVVVNWQAALKK